MVPTEVATLDPTTRIRTSKYRERRFKNIHEVLDNTVELRSLVAIAECLAILPDTGGKGTEVLHSLWDSLTTQI